MNVDITDKADHVTIAIARVSEDIWGTFIDSYNLQPVLGDFTTRGCGYEMESCKP